MESPDDIPGIAGFVAAGAMTAAAVFRAKIRAFMSVFVSALVERTEERPFLDVRSELNRESDNRRSDIDRLSKLIDDIGDRVRHLEETATSWKIESVTAAREVKALQSQVQNIASRMSVDMDGLRDLLLEILKRTR